MNGKELEASGTGIIYGTTPNLPQPLRKVTKTLSENGTSVSHCAAFSGQRQYFCVSCLETRLFGREVSTMSIILASSLLVGLLVQSQPQIAQ